MKIQLGVESCKSFELVTSDFRYLVAFATATHPPLNIHPRRKRGPPP
jgi:hypothetical protein